MRITLVILILFNFYSTGSVIGRTYFGYPFLNQEIHSLDVIILNLPTHDLSGNFISSQQLDTLDSFLSTRLLNKKTRIELHYFASPSSHCQDYSRRLGESLGRILSSQALLNKSILALGNSQPLFADSDESNESRLQNTRLEIHIE